MEVQDVVGASGGAICAAVLATGISIDDYAMAFCHARGRGLQLLQDFWKDNSNNNNNDLTTTSTNCNNNSTTV